QGGPVSQSLTGLQAGVGHHAQHSLAHLAIEAVHHRQHQDHHHHPEGQAKHRGEGDEGNETAASPGAGVAGTDEDCEGSEHVGSKRPFGLENNPRDAGGTSRQGSPQAGWPSDAGRLTLWRLQIAIGSPCPCKTQIAANTTASKTRSHCRSFRWTARTMPRPAANPTCSGCSASSACWISRPSTCCASWASATA